MLNHQHYCWFASDLPSWTVLLEHLSARGEMRFPKWSDKWFVWDMVVNNILWWEIGNLDVNIIQGSQKQWLGSSLENINNECRKYCFFINFGSFCATVNSFTHSPKRIDNWRRLGIFTVPHTPTRVWICTSLPQIICANRRPFYYISAIEVEVEDNCRHRAEMTPNIYNDL